MLAIGNEVILTDKSIVGTDLLLLVDKAQINGQVGRNAKLIGSEIIISGKIAGDVLIKDVQKLSITKDAVINGKLTYSSPNQAQIENGAVISGAVDYRKTNAQNNWKSMANRTSSAITLYSIIGSILLLLLFVYLAPKNSQRFLDNSITEAFRNLWWGLLILIVTPILAIILLAISFKLTAILFLAYILLLMLASTFSALIAGAWLIKNFSRDEVYKADWRAAIAGVIVLAMLSFIPVAGPVLAFLLMLISLGSLSKLLSDGIAK